MHIRARGGFQNFGTQNTIRTYLNRENYNPMEVKGGRASPTPLLTHPCWPVARGVI